MKPSIGRIVHYTQGGSIAPVRAALITRVNDDGTVDLHVFAPPDPFETRQYDLPNVAFTDEKAGTKEAIGKWCWPAREGV